MRRLVQNESQQPGKASIELFAAKPVAVPVSLHFLPDEP